jgi:hypothetical protein
VLDSEHSFGSAPSTPCSFHYSRLLTSTPQVTYTCYFHYFCLGDKPQLQSVVDYMPLYHVVLAGGKREE